MNQQLTIDPEFRDLCRALTPEERSLLDASIDADGCRDPIVVWANHSDTILDGHNRYEICTQLEKTFKTKAISLPDRQACIEWIIANQLGKRNLTESEKEFLRGKRYRAEKKAASGRADRDLSGSQSGNPKTAERLGQEYNVSKNTILRNADFADAVDQIATNVGTQAKSEILSETTGLTRKQIQEVAATPAPEQAKAYEKAKAACHVSKNTGVPEWYTPDEYLDAAREALDRIQRGHGTGSQLWRLLSDLGIQHTPTCTCLALARKMNDRGPAWCKAHRTQLAEQMRVNAAAYGWGTVAKAAATAILSGLAFRLDVLDVYGSLLDEAIRRAEAAAPARQKLILASHLCPGDLLTMTAAIESLHAIYPDRYTTDVRTGHPDIWRANPHVTPIADDDPDVRAIQLHYPLIQRCNQVSAPFLAGYTEYLGQQLGKPLSLTTNRPHLYLTPAERSRPRKELWSGAPDLSRPFWIVNAGIKQDFTVKQWPVEHYQAVIDATRHKVQWVQIGLAADNHPRLRHVISLLDTGPPMRPLILLAYHAAGGMGPVTFLQHLLAAWQKPYLCLAGGREPTTWTQYQAQHTFHTLGQLDCCRTQSCWRGRVLPLGDGHEADQALCGHPVQDMRFSRPVGRCMAMIKPAELIAVLERHLEVNQ